MKQDFIDFNKSSNSSTPSEEPEADLCICLPYIMAIICNAVIKSENADPQQISQDFVFSFCNTVIHANVRISASTTTNSLLWLSQTEPEFQPLTETKTVSAEDVGFASDNFHYRHKLALLKEKSPQIIEAKPALSHRNFITIMNEDVWNTYRCLRGNKNVSRSFCQCSKINKGDTKREMYMKKLKDHTCVRERLCLSPDTRN
ncbi:hypothetical protein A0J61_07306 [Choanephora cucurbitarum]|uniref:Uncharacterized protein n=1 Tax=Choanephora cucurbitarum TaxID=101091 RepID=A0A1C7N682_9FUNG|nr:hypothetical protein A0J61_07306 [Choanephora cucurbitarum]